MHNIFSLVAMSLLLQLCVIQNVTAQQVELEDISFDEYVSFKFPTESETMDTLSQKVHFNRLNDFVTVLASYMDGQTYDHNSLEALKSGYTSFLQGIKDTATKAKIRSSEYIKVGNLLAQRSLLDYKVNGNKMRIDTLVIFIQNRTYTFQNIYLIGAEVMITYSVDDIMKTLDFGSLVMKDQFTE